MDEKFNRRFLSFCNSYLISDEAWMKMLRVRNELAHDYDGEIVKEHCDAIIGTYIDLFYEFENTVKELMA